VERALVEIVEVHDDVVAWVVDATYVPDEIGTDVDLAQVSDQQLAAVLQRLWGHRAPATWNRNKK
jgi:hypothetical protein